LQKRKEKGATNCRERIFKQTKGGNGKGKRYGDAVES